MALSEKIQIDFKTAFKAKNGPVVATLRMLISAIRNKETEKRTRLAKTEALDKLEALSRLNDEEVLGVISSEAKRRREAIEQYQRGGRTELAGQEEMELKILMEYLPAQLSEEEVANIVRETIKETGLNSLKDLGRLMAALMPKVKGRAEGNLVGRIVKEELIK